jgi:hypothetical protein
VPFLNKQQLFITDATCVDGVPQDLVMGWYDLFLLHCVLCLQHLCTCLQLGSINEAPKMLRLFMVPATNCTLLFVLPLVSPCLPACLPCCCRFDAKGKDVPQGEFAEFKNAVSSSNRQEETYQQHRGSGSSRMHAFET